MTSPVCEAAINRLASAAVSLMLQGDWLIGNRRPSLLVNMLAASPEAVESHS